MGAWDIDINAVSINKCIIDLPHIVIYHRKFIHRANAASCSHGMVRLVNGTSKYEGRVEVCLCGIWKTVCGNFWDNHGARVVCTQLGYQGDGKCKCTCCS